MQIEAGALLKNIQYPTDLRKLKESELEQVCQELRQYIIDVVSVNGGHFAASLGVVDLEPLAVSLHDQEMLQPLDVVHVLDLGIVLLRVLDLTRKVVLDCVDKRSILSHHPYYARTLRDPYLAQ